MGKGLLHRRELVILTAIEIIDEIGIQGLSTREIAKRQGISEGTLFRHFKTKNDIVLAVLDYFSKYDDDIIQSARIKGLRPRDAITFFVDSYATYYENYPAITAMTQIYGVLAYESSFLPKVNSILDDRKSFLKKVIEDGQKVGDIKAGADSEALANVIIGTFGEICLSWRLSTGKFPLREKTLSALEMILTAFSPLANEGE